MRYFDDGSCQQQAAAGNYMKYICPLIFFDKVLRNIAYPCLAFIFIPVTKTGRQFVEFLRKSFVYHQHVDIIIDSVKNPSREAKALTINLRP
jgi:hypothetical protein